MSKGKAASQAGHAYLGAFLHAQKLNTPYVAPYGLQAPGTKVCLHGSISELEQAVLSAKELGIPHFLVVDSGCNNFYDGKPIVTALGIGPCPRHIINSVTGTFQLLN